MYNTIINDETNDSNRAQKLNFSLQNADRLYTGATNWLVPIVSAGHYC